MILTRQFGLGEDRMDLRMTSRVKNSALAFRSSLQLRHQMVTALVLGWNRPTTERADLPIA